MEQQRLLNRTHGGWRALQDLGSAWCRRRSCAWYRDVTHLVAGADRGRRSPVLARHGLRGALRAAPGASRAFRPHARRRERHARRRRGAVPPAARLHRPRPRIGAEVARHRAVGPDRLPVARENLARIAVLAAWVQCGCIATAKLQRKRIHFEFLLRLLQPHGTFAASSPVVGPPVSEEEREP